MNRWKNFKHSVTKKLKRLKKNFNLKKLNCFTLRRTVSFTIEPITRISKSQKRSFFIAFIKSMHFYAKNFTFSSIIDDHSAAKRARMALQVKKKYSKSRSKRRSWFNYAFLKYLLQCPDLPSKLNEFIERAKSRSQNPPSEIIFIQKYVLNRTSIVQKKIALPRGPINELNFNGQTIGLIKPFGTTCVTLKSSGNLPNITNVEIDPEILDTLL